MTNGDAGNTYEDDDAKLIAMGSMFAMYLVAMADGQLQPGEKDVITQVVSAYKRDLPPREILQLIEKTLEMFADAGPEVGPELFNGMRQLPGDGKLLILHAAATTALADGNPDPKSRMILGMIAGWLELSDSDKARWIQEFRDRCG